MVKKKPPQRQGPQVPKPFKVKSVPFFVKSYREGLGLSVRDFAKLVGEDHSYIVRVENGYYLFPHRFLQKLYHLLESSDNKRQLIEAVAEQAGEYIQRPVTDDDK